MLNKLDMSQTLDKKQYKETMHILENTLFMLQQTIIRLGIPVMVVFEGFSASGKGTCIARAVHPLDPRFFNVWTMGKVNESMQTRPFLCSYWTYSPAKGRITFFDKSWHRLILPTIREAWKLSPTEMSGFYHDAIAFEQQLTDDGTLIIKFFLHIDKDEQRRRFKELEKNPDTAWRVNADDWNQNRNYEQHKKAYELMLSQTSGVNPWHIIEANDNKLAAIKMLRTIITCIENLINAPPKENSVCDFFDGPPILHQVDANKTIDDAQYKREITHYQQQLSLLGYKLYAKRRPTVIVFEGWDASGKGGSIKRLTEVLDPRAYEVVAISAPTPQELAQHYLWRFYKKMPKDGHITIFDRSWYGRVLVERVEKFASEAEWGRAYNEINDMEAHLAHHGTIIIKFWLHIDQDEQLKRFTSRQNDPLKKYKLSDEDWRNRDKWKYYEAAADEMFARTDTTDAPWHVIEASQKKFARVKVLKTVVETLQKALR